MALLLPLQGNLSNSGQAIRNGFFAAYYHSLQKKSHLPTIRVVDTSSGDIIALYNQVIEQGADFVVGPLTKEDVMRVAKLDSLPVPTLALNTIPSSRPINNFYQFGLSPEDEAKQVADKAWRNGHKRVVVIAPANNWGERVAEVMLARWQELGGQVVDTLFYGKPQQLSVELAKLLGVEQSEQRSKLLQHLLGGTEIRSITYRRQDIDAFFVVAKPLPARQIHPLLKFYYAGDLPVYATSHVYNGVSNPKSDQDLNGILFCAIPAAIAPDTLSVDQQAILQRIKETWPKAYEQQPQLFAFGMDSYELTMRLITEGQLPEAGWKGTTGLLYIQSNKVIYRQLPWVKMDDGKVRLSP